MLPLRSSLRLLALLALLAALALQPISVALASMLGQRHTHREPSHAKVWIGLVGNWHGSARAVPDTRAATVAAHALLHGLGRRHHHGIDDPSVVALEPLANVDGAAVDASPAPTTALAFVAASGIAMQPARETGAAAWSTLEPLAPASQSPRRIERPPNRVA